VVVGVCCTLIRKQRMNPPARAPRTQQSTPHRGRSCRSKPWMWRMSSALSIRAPAKVSLCRREQGETPPKLWFTKKNASTAAATGRRGPHSP